jgi:hypothetical protein
MNTGLLETLKALCSDPSRAIDLYQQLFTASLFSLVQEGSEKTLNSSLFLTYPCGGDIRELPVFTRQEYVLTEIPDDAILIQYAGPLLWKRLLEIVETGRCEAAIDPGQPHGIRLNREMILGMVIKYGKAEEGVGSDIA